MLNRRAFIRSAVSGLLLIKSTPLVFDYGYKSYLKPDPIGDVLAAFEELQRAARRGYAAFQALEDLAFEAIEAGYIKSPLEVNSIIKKIKAGEIVPRYEEYYEVYE